MFEEKVSPSSFGRARELQRLGELLTDAQRLGASPRVAFVRGPKGIGRSFLLRLVRDEARARGLTVFEGAPNGHAYGLFSQVIPEALESLGELGYPDRDVAALARATAPISGRAARDGAADTPAHERQLALFDAACDVLTGVGRHAPPVVLLDDVHLADGGSLELLRYVLTAFTGPGHEVVSPGSAGPARALIVVSFADDGSLPETLQTLVDRTPATTLPLGGLDREGLRAFLQRPGVADRILDSTGGVPERIEALLTADADAVVTDLYGRRLEALDAEDARLLDLVAAAEAPLPATALTQLLVALGDTRSVDQVADALEHLVAARLLAAQTVSGQAVFSLARAGERERHLRRLGDDRARVHAALAAWLSEQPGVDPARVMRHWLVVDPVGEGLAWALRAGETLTARLAWQEAAHAYTDALEALPATAGDAASELWDRLVVLNLGMAEYRAALGWLGRLKGQALRQSELDEVRGLRVRSARALLSMGRAHLAQRQLELALGAADAEQPTDETSMHAAADLAEAFWNQGRYEEASELAETVLGQIGSREDGALPRLNLRNTLGKVLLHRGEYAEARARFSANAEEAGARDLVRERAKALNNLGVVAQRQGQRRQALEHYRASLALRQGAGDKSREAFALQNIAALYHETGDFDKALDHYHRALTGFTRAGSAAQVARVACNLGSLYGFLGDLERGRQLATHAAAVAGEVGDPYLQGYAAMVEGDLDGAEEKTSEARAHYRQALDAFTRIDSPRYAVEVRLALSRILVTDGELKAARALLDEVEETLTDTRFSGLTGDWQLAIAEVALATEDHETAARALSRAKSHLIDAPDLEGPIDLYFDLARLREALGDSDGAEVNLSRSQRLLDELASRVPVSHRNLFLSLPRRRRVREAAAVREITPDAVRRALSLDGPSDGAPVVAASQRPFARILGSDARLKRVLSMVDRVGQVTTPVLIRGESGTGKELIADAIHHRGPRQEMPFVKVNCAAMHEELLLSELFGHEKGAFTGAVKARKGRFELADGGTLFLDEIGDISPKAQVALLRVLQNGEFERVGGTKTQKVDVRVICATNRDLEAMMTEGSFREDLYYRLKGAMLELPPLRERTGDIPLLLEHFLQKVAAERNEPARAVSPEVMQVLVQHTWPGNIRELENIVRSLALFAPEPVIALSDLEHHPELTAGHPAPHALPAHVDEAVGAEDAPGEGSFFAMARKSGLSLKDFKREIELACIREALDEADGNISEASRLLGMKRSRLSQIINADEDLKALARGKAR